MTQPPRILFVCLGNICRSPTAHGVFHARAASAGLAVRVDSAGTGDWHIGKPPDRRSIRAAARRGYDLGDLRARQFTAQDFIRFDLIIAMDRTNLRDINALRPNADAPPTRLFLDYAGLPGQDVPDPYLDGGFDRVLDLIETGADGLIAALRAQQR